MRVTSSRSNQRNIHRQTQGTPRFWAAWSSFPVERIDRLATDTLPVAEYLRSRPEVMSAGSNIPMRASGRPREHGVDHSFAVIGND